MDSKNEPYVYHKNYGIGVIIESSPPKYKTPMHLVSFTEPPIDEWLTEKELQPLPRNSNE